MRSAPISVTRSIGASSNDLWAAISAPGNLEHAHPFCARNPVISWPGRESCDKVHYLSGWVYHRRFVDWIDGVGYELEIGSDGEARSEVSWRITGCGDGDGTGPGEPRDPGRADLTITIRPRPIDRGPAVLQRPIQSVYVRPLLRRYLHSVVGGFEWWVTTGDPVPKNQFGRHPWFSEPR